VSSGRRRPGLVAVWLLLAVLIVAIVVIEYADRRTASQSPNQVDARLLLELPLAQLGAVEIADRGRRHRFERDAAGAWFYHGEHAGTAAGHTHRPDPALAERIERTFAAFARTRIERRFALDRGGATYGVASPEILIFVYRPQEAQPLAQYAIGHVAPDTVSRYVMVVGRAEVGTIPKYQIDNLLELIEAATEPGRSKTAKRRRAACAIAASTCRGAPHGSRTRWPSRSECVPSPPMA
jgi:hypothetical protein